jgi:type IV pilus assembly protein PilA
MGIATSEPPPGDGERGFTLIELMVVVLIVGILLAIAIPSFLTARDRAHDRSAQSNLRNALTSEMTLFVDSQTFIASPAPALSASEPTLNWVAAPPGGGRDVSATIVNGNGGAVAPSQVILAAKSATGTCFYIGDEELSGGTKPGRYYAASSICAAPAGLWGASPPVIGSRADAATAAWAASW